MGQYRIAVRAGDGIGKEVMPEAKSERSNVNEIPNFRPTASSTRTPSGMTSFPIPSPARTAILY